MIELIIILAILLIPFSIGLFLLKKFRYYRLKEPNGYKWKIYLILGSILTLIVPGVIAYFLLYYVFFRPTCYMLPPQITSTTSSLLLIHRKELLEKYRKKIGSKVYEKIKAIS